MGGGQGPPERLACVGVLLLGCFLILLVLILPILVSPVRFEGISRLPLGWVQFLTRAGPRITWNWASALIPLRRSDFSIDNLGLVYSSWPVGALLSLRAVGTWML